MRRHQHNWRAFGVAVGLAALGLATASCGDVVRSSRAPVILVVNSMQAAQGNHTGNLAGTLSSDVITNVTSPAPCSPTTPCPTIFDDIAQVALGVAMKDATVTPTSNNQVTITHYHVDYRRADGLNTPGLYVPYGFDGAFTLTVAAGGTGTATFELVRSVAKEETPLVQLKTIPNVISTIADVTFYGKDLVGNDVTATGSILINFGNFGDSQ
jgi:hypothetical protein